MSNHVHCSSSEIRNFIEVLIWNSWHSNFEQHLYPKLCLISACLMPYCDEISILNIIIFHWVRHTATRDTKFQFIIKWHFANKMNYMINFCSCVYYATVTCNDPTTNWVNTQHAIIVCTLETRAFVSFLQFTTSF